MSSESVKSRTTVWGIIEALVARHLDKDLPATVQAIEYAREQEVWRESPSKGNDTSNTNRRICMSQWIENIFLARIATEEGIVRRNKNLICGIFVCIFLVACGDVNYHGQAFIKHGGVVNTLIDMEIHVIDEVSLASEEQQFKNNVEIAYATIMGKQKQLSVNDDELQTLKKALVNLTEVGQWLTPPNPPTLPKVKSNLESVEGLLNASHQRISHEIELLKQGSHPAIFYIKTLNDTTLSTRTDTDGKFSIKVRNPKGRLIVARQNQYYWYLRLPEKDSVINLSDSNVNESSCANCAFAGELNRNIRDKIGLYAIEIIQKKGEENARVNEPLKAEQTNDDLIENCNKLIKRAKAHVKEYEDISLQTVVFEGLPGPGAARERVNLQLRAIDLHPAIDKSQEMRMQSTNELLKRTSALESAILSLR